MVPPPTAFLMAAFRTFMRVVMSTGASGSGGTAATSGIGGCGNAAFPVMHLMTQPRMDRTMAAGIYLYAWLNVTNFVFVFIFLPFLLLFVSVVKDRAIWREPIGSALVSVPAFNRTI